MIALVDLINTNVMTLFLSRLLTRPNVEQIRKWLFVSQELFSCFFFLIWVKLRSVFEIILSNLPNIFNFRTIRVIHRSTYENFFEMVLKFEWLILAYQIEAK